MLLGPLVLVAFNKGPLGSVRHAGPLATATGVGYVITEGDKTRAALKFFLIALQAIDRFQKWSN